MHGDQLLLRVKLQKLISVSQVGGLALSVTPNGVPPLPKGEALAVRQSFWLRQGLSLWESWQTRKGLTERARLLM